MKYAIMMLVIGALTIPLLMDVTFFIFALMIFFCMLFV